ncbi:protein ORF105 [Cyprinid herpesvirus 3]|nr:unnamed protein product [Cyprinid herpesvirus 3]ABG42932.2 protein ORF105 [Cyprinid herpesvirus 3]AIC32460.1 ORF105R [Cyprinid herpesvirus 3]AJP55593.1 protein ORF105 [Cyprinid herpesvirus 3]AJP55748.1 protein ORF105 [Cyprinid herpesvirus 3]AOO32509.1 protein ORF105 [Cyprinid herpesvirus 3]
MDAGITVTWNLNDRNGYVPIVSDGRLHCPDGGDCVAVGGGRRSEASQRKRRPAADGPSSFRSFNGQIVMYEYGYGPDWGTRATRSVFNLMTQPRVHAVRLEVAALHRQVRQDGESTSFTACGFGVQRSVICPVGFQSVNQPMVDLVRVANGAQPVVDPAVTLNALSGAVGLGAWTNGSGVFRFVCSDRKQTVYNYDAECPSIAPGLKPYS